MSDWYEDEEEKTLTEDVLGEFGFRVVWRYRPHWADVRVYDITSRTVDGEPLFDRDGRTSLPDPVDSIEEAEVYLDGFVKWDGCSELDQGNPHWCGAVGFGQHILLLEYIYKRAFQLMGGGPEEEFPLKIEIIK